MPHKETSETWSRDCQDMTGHNYMEASVDHPDGPYPAMVQVEWEPGTILALDARAYAAVLLAAAEVADQRNEAAQSSPDRPEGDN